jgi:long-chain acyl-CoA synthetase
MATLETDNIDGESMTITVGSDAIEAKNLTTTTVASLARDRAQRHPEQVAMREKDFGIWHEYTWSDAWGLIADAANGLLALGLQPGERVSIHSEDRPEWVILDLATVAVRGITVGLYPTNPASEVEYLLKDSGAGVHFAENEEQFDKVDEVDRDRLAELRTIIFVETRGMVGKEDDRLLFWDKFLEMGREFATAHPGELDERMSAARDDDVMTLVYTSGTTGPPKGAMLTNANAAFCIDSIVNAQGRVPGKAPSHKDQIVTYLPLCHIAERIFSTWTMVGSGPVLNFAESIDTVNESLREIQPTIFFGVPRIWEKLQAVAVIKSGDASRFKRLFLKIGQVLGRKIGRIKAAHGGEHTMVSRIYYAVGWVLVFRAMRERLGLRRCRYAGCGAAPIAPEVLEFFLGIGVPVFELYGMTENSAIATANFVGRMELGTVGEPYPDIGFRLDESTGEIEVKHDGVFKGYWNGPEETAETFTADGWLKTGDIGEWVNGTHVRIVDRIKHIIITSGGKNISPSEIENSLKASPYVKEAMVVGDGRKYLVALIGIEVDTVAKWAVRGGIPYTTYRDLTKKTEVIELVDQIVADTNERFARVENIRQFRLLPKELDHEDGELTATQKLKRKSMMDAYRDLVESMY